MATRSHRRPANLAFALALGMVALTAGACRDTDPNTPISQALFPSVKSGVVEMRYVLRNQDTASASISASFARLNEPFQAATPVPGTEGTTGLIASPGGTAHIFSWDALNDLGPGLHTVLFQIIPTIGGQVGTSSIVGPFTVTNVGIPERLADLSTPLVGGAASVSATGGVLITGGSDLTGAAVEVTGDGLALETRGSLNNARQDHAQVTGVVAATGEVAPVVFGGRNASGPLASVERYDATADAWFALTDLPEARSGHTATLLGTGRHVLIAGGTGTGGLVATDRVYDLATGTSIAATGSATGAARTGHTATLLPDGRVLICGGEDAGGTQIDTSFIVRFDTTAGTVIYAQGPALTKPRSNHGAALLGDTLVVIGGTTTGGTIDDGAETLDATLSAGAAFAALTETATGGDAAMSSPRTGHAVIALGDTAALVVGGSDGTTALDTLDQLSLSFGAFVPTPLAMTAERSKPIAVVFGAGVPLIAGGGVAAVELFRPLGDAVSGGVTPEVAAAPGRVGHAVSALVNGRALVTGGASGRLDGGNSVPLASASLFDTREQGIDRLVEAGSMNTAREQHAQAVLDDGRVVVAGGLGASGVLLDSLEAWDPDTDTFGALTPVLPSPRSGLSAATLDDGRVLLIGGDAGSGPLTDVQVLAADGDSIAAGVPMAQARSGHATFVVDDGAAVVVIGGDAGGTVERFDVAVNTWTTLTGALPNARSGIAAAALTSGTEILVAGGFDATGQPLADVAVIDLDAGTVTAKTTSLLQARGDATAVALSNGSAVIAGGVVEVDATAIAPGARRTTSIEKYTTTGDGTAEAADDPDLPSAASGQRVVTTTFDGTTILFGGRDASGAARASAEVMAR